MKKVGSTFKWLSISVYVLCAIAIIMFLTPVGGWKALDVLTGSMRPAIAPGALVFIHRVPLGSIQPGNIVTYHRPGSLTETITHRVVKVEKVGGVTTITVKGDANSHADAPFTSGYLVGRVAFIVPGAGKDISYLHNPWWLAALVIIPGLFVIWSEIVRLRKALAKPKTEQVVAASGNDPPEPPAPPPPSRPTAPAALEQSPQSPRPAPRRSLDGMKRLALAVAVVTLASGTAAAATRSVGTVHLTRNTFTAVSSGSGGGGGSQFPCPPGFVIISETGAGSVNIFKCKSTNLSTNITINITLLKNINIQNSSSGNVTNTGNGTSNGGSSGNSSNSNNTSNTVTNSTATPSPSPTPQTTPSVKHSPSPTLTPSPKV